jgi:hypothetical protein
MLMPQNLPTNLNIFSIDTQHMTQFEILFAQAYENDIIPFKIFKDLENRKKQ